MVTATKTRQVHPLQVATIAAALRRFLLPGQVTEIRGLDVGTAKALTFISPDIDALAHKAAEWDQAEAKGVYFIPNPIRPDLAGSRASSRKEDVIERRWLLIDIDPVRPAGTSATDEERQAAWTVLCRVRGELEGAGDLNAPIVGDSGNGWHLCYPVLLPNDAGAQEQIKHLLKGLGKRCNSTAAQVDTSTHDAPRIWKLYGTHARKGFSTVERPHRLAAIVEPS